MKSLPYAEVHLPIPNSRGYTYRVPAELSEQAKVGCRALVPLGKRKATGFIVRRTDRIDFDAEKLKNIIDILDESPLFDDERFELAKWVADYYLASLGEVLRTMLPPGLEKETKQFVKLTRELTTDEINRIRKSAPLQAELIEQLTGKKGYKISYLKRQMGERAIRSSITSLVEQGLVEVSNSWSRPKIRSRLATFVKLTPSGIHCVEQLNGGTANDDQPGGDAGEWKLTAKQQSALKLLHARGEISQADFVQKSGLSSSVLHTLEKKSLLSKNKRAVEATVPVEEDSGEHVELTLNPEQRSAVDQIVAAVREDRFQVFLIHGITGSGKTQVYIDSIRTTLELGKGAIVLVPEISLTPQTVARFHHNFGAQIAVLHSRLNASERYEEWKRIQRGEARVVIGARSAVFAPVKKLGLVIVDEEQESSYKQFDPSPRYHARDVAVMRAKMSGAVVALGSATPAVETYANARSGKYRLLELPNRIDDVPLPSVRIVDMMRYRTTAPDHEGIFSYILYEKIVETLERNEQIILLQNRRGFAPIIRCTKCGYTRLCDACNISLTFHKRGHVMRCHYCNYTERAPDFCPQCGSLDLIFKGIGTQRVEHALQQLLPDARIVRMDLDTTRGKQAHHKILKDFDDQRYDVLLGTQMIAKGLDFHRVTLVGVISADTTLLRPDFRAGERTFQLLTQVAGRAGRRNLPGEVVIQSYSPEDFALVCAKNHDFKRFFLHEIRQRQTLRYPPYTRIAVIYFRHRDNDRVSAVAEDFATLLRARKRPISVHGPTPAPMQRIKNEYRWQIMVKSEPAKDPGASTMRSTLAEVLQFVHKAQSNKRLRVHIDIDPAGMG